jgi:hypothetical protein
MANTSTVDRIRAEYLEMPGLRLTLAQAERVFGLDPGLCREALDVLVGAKFLYRRTDGCYARWSDGDRFRPRPAGAGLERQQQAFERAS